MKSCQFIKWCGGALAIAFVATLFLIPTLGFTQSQYQNLDRIDSDQPIFTITEDGEIVEIDPSAQTPAMKCTTNAGCTCEGTMSCRKEGDRCVSRNWDGSGEYCQDSGASICHCKGLLNLSEQPPWLLPKKEGSPNDPQ